MFEYSLSRVPEISFIFTFILQIFREHLLFGDRCYKEGRWEDSSQEVGGFCLNRVVREDLCGMMILDRDVMKVRERIMQIF